MENSVIAVKKNIQSDIPPQQHYNLKEYLWYREHEQELLEKHFGDYLVIKDFEIKGAYTTRKEAHEYAHLNYKAGTFIVHHCVKEAPKRISAHLSGGLGMSEEDIHRFPNFKEFLWYLSNESELLEKFPERYLLIKNGQVVADYGSRSEARSFAYQFHQPGTFIIRHCVPNEQQKVPKITNQRLVAIPL